MPEHSKGTVTRREIAHDQAEYLAVTDGVCAEGNVRGWRWVRFHNGEWQAAKYHEGRDRLKDYVVGDVLDESRVLEWLVAKPVTILPQSQAYLWGPSEATVWEDAVDQDVYTDHDRCHWCGCSERTHDLEAYETKSDGECLLCSDCHDSWSRAGEIAGQNGGEAGA